jgi:hypothetical protein
MAFLFGIKMARGYNGFQRICFLSAKICLIRVIRVPLFGFPILRQNAVIGNMLILLRK